MYRFSDAVWLREEGGEERVDTLYTDSFALWP